MKRVGEQKTDLLMFDLYRLLQTNSNLFQCSSHVPDLWLEKYLYVTCSQHLLLNFNGSNAVKLIAT